MFRSLIPILALGCSEPFGGESSSSGIPNPLDDAQTDGCEELEGASYAGAVSYFLGDFQLADEQWTGTESWILYANEAWKDAGESDCRVVWSIIAEEVSPSECSDCDLGLQLEASIDDAQTDCPEDIYEGDEQFEANYDVQRSEDGTSSWYFAETGSLLGEGYHGPEALNYLSALQCLWF
jgi:hypothetical protein